MCFPSVLCKNDSNFKFAVVFDGLISDKTDAVVVAIGMAHLFVNLRENLPAFGIAEKTSFLIDDGEGTKTRVSQIHSKNLGQMSC